MTLKGTKKYSKEFKIRAVELAHETSVSQVSKDLGIPHGTISGWYEKVHGKKSKTIASLTTVEPTVAELKALLSKRDTEIEYLNKINSYLKKNIAIFTKDIL